MKEYSRRVDEFVLLGHRTTPPYRAEIPYRPTHRILRIVTIELVMCAKISSNSGDIQK